MKEIEVPEAVSDLAAWAVLAGSNLRLVQGAGGNLSVKDDSVMWIKASGTRLSTALEYNIFTPMDWDATRSAVLETEDLAQHVVPDLPGSDLRPSIETALHALLPHQYVFHLHAIGSIAAGLSGEKVEAVAESLRVEGRTVLVVPYAKPGIELARAVIDRLPGDLNPSHTLVLMLRNHGLVVAGPSIESVWRQIEEIESELVTVPMASRSDAASADGWSEMFPPGTLSDIAITALCAGALTPDSAVFLGPRPFVREHSEQLSIASAIVTDSGAVQAKLGLGDDEVEILVSLVDAARQLQSAAQWSALSDEQVAELVNWEAEKWRHQMKR